jgi:transcriptional regulator with XRE-family HTH domain
MVTLKSTAKSLILGEDIRAMMTANNRKAPVVKVDEKLAKLVGRALNNLRVTYCEVNHVTMEKFAKKVGVSKKHLYALEAGKSSPTVNTLNSILKACNSDLLDFFYRLVTHGRLAEIKLKTSEDERLIKIMISGLGHPKGRILVESAAAGVSAFLDLDSVR